MQRQYNDLMHPRNRYKQYRPDLDDWCKRHKDLERCTLVDRKSGRRVVDWKNPQSPYLYTKACLSEDFHIEWQLRQGNLCPPLTRSLNYLHWVEDLLLSVGAPSFAQRGIDIGTGASCIFPLLGASLNSHWSFLATDVDERSVLDARQLVQRNPHLQDNVSVELVPRDTFFAEAIKRDNAHWHQLRGACPQIPYAFSMCNPPFFANEQDAPLHDRDSPFQGTTSELFHQGDEHLAGELGFIKNLIDDSNVSATMRHAVYWFTSMIGRKKTIKPILRYLKAVGAVQTRTTTLYQGKTLRWAVAWSFHAPTGTPEASSSANISALGDNVFAKKKRQEDTFQVINSTTSQVETRFLEAVDNLPKALSKGLFRAEKKTSAEESNRRVEFVCALPGSTFTFSMAHTPPSTVECTVTLVSTTDRKHFWSVADALKRDTQRTSRKWRRKTAEKAN